MHSNVTIKNVSWPHFSWPTLYFEAQSRIHLYDLVLAEAAAMAGRLRLQIHIIYLFLNTPVLYGRRVLLVWLIP